MANLCCELCGVSEQSVKRAWMRASLNGDRKPLDFGVRVEQNGLIRYYCPEHDHLFSIAPLSSSRSASSLTVSSPRFRGFPPRPSRS
jgi:hypothetical protein